MNDNDHLSAYPCSSMKNLRNDETEYVFQLFALQKMNKEIRQEGFRYTQKKVSAEIILPCYQKGP